MHFLKIMPLTTFLFLSMHTQSAASCVAKKVPCSCATAKPLIELCKQRSDWFALKEAALKAAQRYAKIYSDNNTEKYIAFSNQKPTNLKDVPQIYAKN
jgi:hypothetical protein